MYVFILTLVLVSLVGAESYSNNLLPEDDEVMQEKEMSVEAGIKREMSAESRIKGGQEATEHEYPFMVAVHVLYLYKLNGRSRAALFYFCGGTIINSEFILTAAHCQPRLNVNLRLPNGTLVPATYYFSYLNYGENHRGSFYPDYRVTYRTHFCNNIHYRYFVHGHDIALIRVNPPIPFNSRVQPITLPESDTPKPADEVVYFAGWGITDAGTIPYSLHEGHATGLSDSECSSRLFGLFIHSGLMCTLSPPSQYCNGDSGGPAMVLRNNGTSDYYEQRGIVSFGIIGCPHAYPSVQTFVAANREWIDTVIQYWNVPSTISTLCRFIS